MPSAAMRVSRKEKLVVRGDSLSPVIEGSTEVYLVVLLSRRRRLDWLTGRQTFSSKAQTGDRDFRWMRFRMCCT
jgi:hypothetical protein